MLLLPVFPVASGLLTLMFNVLALNMMLPKGELYKPHLSIVYSLASLALGILSLVAFFIWQ
jgi:hypothetical protein